MRFGNAGEDFGLFSCICDDSTCIYLNWSTASRVNSFRSLPLPASPSMASVNRRLLSGLPLMVMEVVCPSHASVIMRPRKMLNRVVEIRHPCRTPTVARNQSPILPHLKLWNKVIG